ncbi:hypothetical protein CRG98_040274 [Punica granatum]|uniref:Uncharacterized protein n=1 Tax=Punica granatum TaxID=22663 RepID=A0A2I0I5Q9_PUNGR|nr:hypothetical protein CRG98_040274 [Punica granatum]
MGPPTQGCQFLEIERDSFQGLSDSRTARRTPTSNPYLTYASISGRGTRPIVESPSCAHPNFVSSGHACVRLNVKRLGSVHLPGDARRTHVRRSRHYLFTTRKSRAGELPGSRGMGYI